MYLVYSFCLSLLFLTLTPYFLYQAVRYRKYTEGFIQRRGWLPAAARYDGCKTVWIHAVSVGEFLAARSLIDRIAVEFAEWRIVVSTTTLTGQKLAKEQSSGTASSVFYFPF